MEASSSKSQETELTMCDVLEEEQELEDDANAVLGGSDDTNCSYDKGYIPRQALYACMTCTTGDAGVCLACCYSCHDKHEVVELYTKRNFRCDCGNSKFKDKKCILKPDKDPLNLKNNYNQNFKGLYCTCTRPYPDPEDSVPDEMIQCVLCEDWYHGRHLKADVPEDYFEMICYKCMASHKFLYSYKQSLMIKKDNENVLDSKSAKENSQVPNSYIATKNECIASTEKGDVSVKSECIQNGSKHKDLVCSKDNNCLPSNGIVTSDANVKEELVDVTSIDSTSDNKPLTDSSSELNKTEYEQCMLKAIDSDKDVNSGSAFWPEHWREKLCRCQHCLNMYEELKCPFLLNSDDTIQAYEERGKGSGKSQYESGLSALSQMDRVKQMEAVRAYTNMKGALKEYLREFAENKRTVCESDIKEFFERMGKKQKLNNGIPHFCR